jgi:hypothetical protein
VSVNETPAHRWNSCCVWPPTDGCTLRDCARPVPLSKWHSFHENRTTTAVAGGRRSFDIIPGSSPDLTSPQHPNSPRSAPRICSCADLSGTVRNERSEIFGPASREWGLGSISFCARVGLRCRIIGQVDNRYGRFRAGKRNAERACVMKSQKTFSRARPRVVNRKGSANMAKSMPQTFRRISTGDAYSISVLARTRPQDREGLYREIKTSLGYRARTIALRILRSSAAPAARDENGLARRASHAH